MNEGKTQDTRVEGRNAWTGYHHLYDYQWDISSFAPENKICESRMNDAKTGRNIQTVNNFITASDQAREEVHVTRDEKTFGKTSDGDYNKDQYLEAIISDKHPIDREDYQALNASPSFYSIDDLKSPFLNQEADDLHDYAGLDTTWSSEYQEGDFNSLDLEREAQTGNAEDSSYQRPQFTHVTVPHRLRQPMKRVLGYLDVNGELKGFWRPNKLY